MRKAILVLVAMGLAHIVAGPATAGSQLDAIRARGQLICGASAGVAGLSIPDSQGHWSGFHVDMCKAFAIAIFNDPNKVKYVPLSTQQRFTALQSGEVDLLSRSTTYTLTRDTTLGLNFAGVTYYDGQGFMVRRQLGVKSATELNGASICVSPGSTIEVNLADYFRARNMKYESVVIGEQDQIEAAFFSGRCDVYTSDAVQLASVRVKRGASPDDYVILPEIISKEPLSTALRRGDDEFEAILKWSLYAMIEAEERGITSANVDAHLKSEDPGVKRLLGVIQGNGKALGVDERWAYAIIKQIGNYGEIFDRNLG
jgi:general L-amino acid transport system substrate-binding protein